MNRRSSRVIENERQCRHECKMNLDKWPRIALVLFRMYTFQQLLRNETKTRRMTRQRDEEREKEGAR